MGVGSRAPKVLPLREVLYSERMRATLGGLGAWDSYSVSETESEVGTGSVLRGEGVETT